MTYSIYSCYGAIQLLSIEYIISLYTVYYKSKLLEFDLEIDPKPQESETDGTAQLPIEPLPQLL